MAVVVALQDAVSAQVHSNAPELASSPPGCEDGGDDGRYACSCPLSPGMLVVVVALPDVPVAECDATLDDLVQEPVAVEVQTDAAVTSKSFWSCRGCNGCRGSCGTVAYLRTTTHLNPSLTCRCGGGTSGGRYGSSCPRPGGVTCGVVPTVEVPV